MCKAQSIRLCLSWTPYIDADGSVVSKATLSQISKVDTYEKSGEQLHMSDVDSTFNGERFGTSHVDIDARNIIAYQLGCTHG